MATKLTKQHIVISICLVILCLLIYVILFAEEQDLIINAFKDIQPSIVLSTDHIQFYTDNIDNNNNNLNKTEPIINNDNFSDSRLLNKMIYSLSPIDRTTIDVSKWKNPSIIKSNTIIIGYCCEIPNKFNCKLQKYVLLFSISLFPNNSIYFQKCKQNGHGPNKSNRKITIKHRRDKSLNNNNAKIWKLLLDVDEIRQIWFMPDLYLCQGYFFSQDIIDTRINGNDYIEVKHEDIIDLLSYRVAIGRKTRFQSHRLQQYRPLLVTMNTEYWGGWPCSRYDIMFDSVINRDNGECFSIYTPPAFWYEFMRINNNTKQLIIPHNNNDKLKYLNNILNLKKESFNYHTLFLVNICFKEGRYKADAIVRVLFYDLLKERYLLINNSSSIDGIGNCRKNSEAKRKLGKYFVERGTDKTFGYQGVRDGAVNIALKYKYMISMENSRTNGYLTEKLFNALYGYSIPIYFGDNYINKHFNDKRFINCNISDKNAEYIHQLTDQNKKDNIKNTEKRLLAQVNDVIGDKIKQCIDRVIEIEKNDTLYQNMLLQPIFKENNYNKSILNPNTVAIQFRKVLQIIHSYLLN